MTRSELIRILTEKQNHIGYRETELAVKHVFDTMIKALRVDEGHGILGETAFVLALHSPGEHAARSKTLKVNHQIIPVRVPGMMCTRTIGHGGKKLVGQRLHDQGNFWFIDLDGGYGPSAGLDDLQVFGCCPTLIVGLDS